MVYPLYGDLGLEPQKENNSAELKGLEFKLQTSKGLRWNSKWAPFSRFDFLAESALSKIISAKCFSLELNSLQDYRDSGRKECFLFARDMIEAHFYWNSN